MEIANTDFTSIFVMVFVVLFVTILISFVLKLIITGLVGLYNILKASDVSVEVVELEDATVYMEVGTRFIFIKNIRGNAKRATEFIEYLEKISHVERSEIVINKLSNVKGV